MHKSLIAALVFVAGIQTASAATITVTSNGDTADLTGGDGTCGSAVPNSCTLRAAIQEANANGDPSNIIEFAAGLNGGTTTAATAYPAITKALTITGPASRFTVDGDDGLSTNVALLRFTATAAGSYTITKLILQNGNTTDAVGGGALYFAPVGADSTLTLADVDITGSTATVGPGGGMAVDIASGTVALTRVLLGSNTASAGNGGGAWLRLVGGGSMSLVDSTVEGNAAVNGGGIEVRRGRLSITRSTIGGNTASADGGGLFLGDDSTTDGSVALENVTISGNSAATGGGIGAASANTAASRAIHTTIARNTATTGGGIGTAAAQNTIFPGDSTNPFTSNIVAENNPATNNNNCKESFTHSSADSGYNRSNNTSCNFAQTTDSQTFDAAWLADTLAANAGATQTHRLLAGSVAAPNTAIDAANPAYANATDQRAAPAADGNADNTVVRDIGAYEFAGFGAVQFTAAAFSVREDGTPAVIGVQRFGNATPAVTAQFSTTDLTATGVASCPGTAATNADYQTVTNATVSFASGQTTPASAIDVNLCGDPGAESDETVALDLANVVAGSDLGAIGSATLTIQEIAEGTLQFSAATFNAAENAGTVNMTIGVTRTGGSSDAVAITYAINGGTASGGGTDYTDATPTPGTLNWASADATTQFIVLALNNDALCELAETVTFQLSNPTNGATLGAQATATFTINDDDGTGAGTLQFENTAYTVNETAGTLTVNVRRVGGCAGTASVDADNVTVAGDTATEPGDFLLLTAATLNWAAGETANKSFDVTIIDDTAVESNQRFSLQLQNASGATIAGTNPVGVTIVSDEQPQLRFEQTSYSRSESGTSITLNVVNDDDIDGGAVSVSFATADGSATAGVDYTAASGTLNWAAGDPAGTPQPITVLIANDGTVEGNETFTTGLGTPTGGAGVTSTNPVTVTIIDPAAVRLAASSFASSAETNASTITVTAERVGNVSGTSSVDFAISQCATAGCATEAVDYNRSGGFTGTLNWAMNETSKSFTITVLGDTAIEGDETIDVALSNPTGAVLASPSSGTAVVTDDDYRFEIVESNPLSVGEADGSATVTVRRFGSTVGAASVAFATADGTATAGSDYTQTASPPALSWTAGEDGTKTILVPITDDALDEAATETFTVSLSAPSNNVSGEATTVTGSPLTVAIADDDAVTVAFSAAAQGVGENAGTVTVTATRTGSTTFAIDVPFTVSGTAANPADHDAVSGTITIPAAAASADYTFAVSDDALDEADETVVFTMGTPTGGDVTAAAPTVHTVTITDDDAVTVAFSAGAQSVAENAGMVTVTATRTGATTFAIGVPFTVSGTATNPADHNAVSGSITIPAAAASGSYTFMVANDVVDEVNETVVFTMGTPTGGDVTSTAPTVHTVTIADNDAVTVAFSAAAQSVAENVGTVTVTAARTGATTFAINVPFTVSGTAANPADHNAVSGTITIPAAAASGSYTFTVVDDVVAEADETVVFTMGTPTGGDVTAGAPTVHTVTIADDESAVGGNDAPAVVVTYNSGSVNVTPASEQGGGAMTWPALAGLLALLGLRRRRALATATALALAGLSTGASAQGLSYDNADLRYVTVSVDEPNVDASGIALAGSWSISKQVFVTTSYSTVETDDFRFSGVTGSSSTDSIGFGLGGHRPIEAGLDVTGGVNVVWAKAEGQGGFTGSVDDIGYGAEVGFRGLPAKSFEWGAALSYVAIFDDGAAGLSVQGLYHLGPRFSLAVGAGVNDDSTQLNLGVRYGFAKNKNKK